MNIISYPLTKYILKAALRDKLILSLAALVICVVSISIFVGSSVLIEADQASLVFIASSIRLLAGISLILFTVFHIRRSFESRDIEYLLSRPLSRVGFVLSHSLGLSLLAVLVGSAFSLGLYLMSQSIIDQAGFLIWSLSLICELIILVNAAFFFAMVLPSAISGALVTLMGYALCRLIGQILGIIHSTYPRNVLDEIMFPMVEATSFIIPRFDLYGQTSWLIYGNNDLELLTLILFQAVTCSAIIICATIFDLARREF